MRSDRLVFHWGVTATTFNAPRSTRRPGAVRSLLLAGVAVLAFAGASRLADLLPGLPFRETTVDRSEPAVLHALEDVARLTAATANYSVILDMEQDTKWVPAFVKGERTTFLAAGAVDASVDLSGISASNIVVDGSEVTITLAPPALGEARIDPGRSRVVDRDRGMLDRVAGAFSDNPTSERGLYLEAQRKLGAAAAADTALVERAQANVTTTLRALLEPLGFERVTVRFEALVEEPAEPQR